jgi:uncharacterized protein YecE (DUF72 family)
MTLQTKLNQLSTAWTALQTKIKAKLASQAKTLTETTQKLNQVNHQLELTAKENSENEKILEQLLKEFKELGDSL